MDLWFFNRMSGTERTSRLKPRSVHEDLEIVRDIPRQRELRRRYLADAFRPFMFCGVFVGPKRDTGVES
jgi:hypothetical protein